MAEHQFQVGDTGKTRDGREYRVICTDAAGLYPVVALLSEPSGRQVPYCYNLMGTGHLIDFAGDDLLPPPPKTKKIVRWVVACTHGSFIYHTEVHATDAAGTDFSLMPDGKPLRIELEVLDR